MSPKPLLDPKTESIQTHKQYYAKRNTATHFPIILLGLVRVDDAFQIHAEVRREEREWKEHNRETGEHEDGFVLRVGDNC